MPAHNVVIVMQQALLRNACSLYLATDFPEAFVNGSAIQAHCSRPAQTSIG